MHVEPTHYNTGDCSLNTVEPLYFGHHMLTRSLSLSHTHTHTQTHIHTLSLSLPHTHIHTHTHSHTHTTIILRSTYLISASKGLINGEPIIVCVFTMWSSRRF